MVWVKLTDDSKFNSGRVEFDWQISKMTKRINQQMVERQLIEKELGSLLEMTLKMEDEVNNLGNDLN